MMPETVFSAQNKKGEKSKNSVCMAYSRERKICFGIVALSLWMKKFRNRETAIV